MLGPAVCGRADTNQQSALAVLFSAQGKCVAALELHLGGHRSLFAVEQDDLHRDHVASDRTRHHVKSLAAGQVEHEHLAGLGARADVAERTRSSRRRRRPNRLARRPGGLAPARPAERVACWRRSAGMSAHDIYDAGPTMTLCSAIASIATATIFAITSSTDLVNPSSEGLTAISLSSRPIVE